MDRQEGARIALLAASLVLIVLWALQPGSFEGGARTTTPLLLLMAGIITVLPPFVIPSKGRPAGERGTFGHPAFLAVGAAFVAAAVTLVGVDNVATMPMWQKIVMFVAAGGGLSIALRKVFSEENTADRRPAD